MKRVLIVGLTPTTGGMETFIMELYRRIDRNRIQFDFINRNPQKKDLAFADEIVRMGGRIYYVPIIRKGPISHFRTLRTILKENHYCAIYYQANYKPRNYDIFRLAKQYGVPIRILHSHNTQDISNRSFVQRIRENISGHYMDAYLTDRFCCSKEAGEWMFGNHRDFTIINNGIDTKAFDYDETVRGQLRGQYHTENQVVYGTVARFSAAKNPFYLIDIFLEIHKLQPNSVFWHIGGGGDLEAQVRERITSLGLDNSYLLLGKKDRVADYLNAMDLFLLPSIHEGLPISLIEAQSSGLRCLVADSITRDVDLTGNITFCSVADSPQKWAETAVTLSDYKRFSGRDTVMEKGFDIESRVAAFETYILSEDHC